MEYTPFNPNEDLKEPPKIPLRERNQEEVIAFANKLDELQGAANSGRGVSAVRDALSYLRRGDVATAESVVRNEWDKIESHPEIAQALINEGIYTPLDFSTIEEPDE